MTQTRYADLAELIALKGRLGDADEVTMLALERAVVEVVFMARMEVAAELRKRGLGTAADRLELDASAVHLAASVRTRAEMLGALVSRDGSVALDDPTAFPADEDRLALTLAFRRTPHYREKLKAWRRVGQRVGDDLDQGRASSAPESAGTPPE